MMKIKIDKARVFVKAKFKSEGSVLAETVKAQGLGFETRLELESKEPPERVAKGVSFINLSDKVRPALF